MRRERGELRDGGMEGLACFFVGSTFCHCGLYGNLTCAVFVIMPFRCEMRRL